MNSGTGEKPFLIIIQNLTNPEQQKESYDSYKIERSTADFNECIQRQKKTQELLQHYREFCFIRLPSWASYPILFDQQICLLQVMECPSFTFLFLLHHPCCISILTFIVFFGHYTLGIV
jgi:hypothetical protein